MNQMKKFMAELKDFLDAEKRLIAQKNIYQRKIDRIKRMDKAKKELEALKKELEALENGKDTK